jgi:hypothetical protein
MVVRALCESKQLPTTLNNFERDRKKSQELCQPRAITTSLNWLVPVRNPAAEHAEQFCLLCYQPKPMLISISARMHVLTLMYPCRAHSRTRTILLHCRYECSQTTLTLH